MALIAVVENTEECAYSFTHKAEINQDMYIRNTFMFINLHRTKLIYIYIHSHTRQRSIKPCLFKYIYIFIWISMYFTLHKYLCVFIDIEKSFTHDNNEGGDQISTNSSLLICQVCQHVQTNWPLGTTQHYIHLLQEMWQFHVFWKVWIYGFNVS